MRCLQDAYYGASPQTAPHTQSHYPAELEKKKEKKKKKVVRVLQHFEGESRGGKKI